MTDTMSQAANKDVEQQNSSASLKSEDEEAQLATFATPSFTGRLDLSSYAFSAKPPLKLSSESQSPRRSPRMQSLTSQSSSSQTTAQQSSSPSRKRKSTTTTHLSSSASPLKRPKSRSPSGYKPPSTYSHLSPLIDVLGPSLLILFVGLNPGIQTASTGHAYAHPSNLFWKLLHSSGITTRRLSPTEDRSLPALFSCGNTNIVSRPSRNSSELLNSELDDSVEVLQEKIRKWRPECVCLVGKSIWESIWRVNHGKKMRKEEFQYGWQDGKENIGKDEGWDGARVFVATSTSGLAASLLPAEKERIWRELGVWVEGRRRERREKT